MRVEEAKAKVENKMKRMVDSDPNLYNAFLLVHSDKHNVHWNMAYGQTGEVPANKDQPYHTASVGKAFTAMIIARLVEEGKINYQDPVAKYLDKELLKNLHVYKGTDYSGDILIEHLISNTSGLADFYEDKPQQGKPFLELILDESSRKWTPEETIEWTKQNLSTKFPPGQKVHYTNTGFNLLGLIIEKVTSMNYHEALGKYIFQPLNMHQSYLSHFSEPITTSKHPVANIYLNKKVDVKDYLSFTSIYASGQTVSTSEDLLKFMKGLVEHQLVSEESLSRMMQWRKMWLGVQYGYGLMKVQMAPFTEKYNVWGHLGSIGSFIFYNPVMDVYIIGNYNKRGYQTKAIRFVYSTLRHLAGCLYK